MGQPYIGEIRMFGGNFAPLNWAFCDGQLMAISENEALFNLIGTTYGGDGQQTFGLPDLRGRLPLHFGSNGQNNHVQGERSGTETVTLTVNQMPAHNHIPLANNQSASSTDPTNNVLANPASTGPTWFATTPSTSLASPATGNTGGSQPHSNMMPFLGINFIISLFGVFPSQT